MTVNEPRAWPPGRPSWILAWKAPQTPAPNDLHDALDRIHSTQVRTNLAQLRTEVSSIYRDRTQRQRDPLPSHALLDQGAALRSAAPGTARGGLWPWRPARRGGPGTQAPIQRIRWTYRQPQLTPGYQPFPPPVRAMRLACRVPCSHDGEPFSGHLRDRAADPA